MFGILGGVACALLWMKLKKKPVDSSEKMPIETYGIAMESEGSV